MTTHENRAGHRQLLRIWGPAVLVAVVAIVIAYQFVDPAPPKRIVIATGSPGGACHAFGEAYSEILARDGIELEVLATAGSLENIALLETPSSDVDVAFVQGGTSVFARTDELESLASLYYEPLWIFHREALPIARPSDLVGRRVSIGPEGSGTRAVTIQLLGDNGIEPDELRLADLDPDDDAVNALRDGHLDVLFVVASPYSSDVQRACHTEGVALTSLKRADAYTRRHKFLSLLTLPEGTIDLETNHPPNDIILLAPTATLVTGQDFHPALVDLLLEAADEVHGGGGLFERPGEFPSTSHLDFPLNKEARRFFESGPPFLRRTLPFWAATLIERMKIMLLPLIALVIPLIRFMPGIYRWRVRSRVFRWYKELGVVEAHIRDGRAAEKAEDFESQLDRMETEVRKVSIPWSYADELYQLRVHIQYVREKLPSEAADARPVRSRGSA